MPGCPFLGPGSGSECIAFGVLQSWNSCSVLRPHDDSIEIVASCEGFWPLFWAGAAHVHAEAHTFSAIMDTKRILSKISSLF